MKICKRIVVLIAAVLILCSAIPAFAAEHIDPSQSISLTISYIDYDIPIAGAEFSIYQAATVDKRGNLTTTKQFAKYNVNIADSNEDTWKTLALTLEGYVLRDKLTPTDKRITNEQGLAHFPNKATKLTPGLYLAMSARQTQGDTVYESLPFMILMPTQDQDTDKWNYNVAVKPKYSSRNRYEVGTVDCKVLKVWDDKGNENNRPENVVIQLLRDGEIYDTVNLNKKNNWRYKWNDLDIQYKWNVVEKELDNYLVDISKEGVTYVVTNTYKTVTNEDPTEPVTSPSNPKETVDPSNPKGSGTPGNPGNPNNPNNPNKPNTPNDPTLPQTGQLWWPVPLLSAAGLFMILMGLLLFRGKNNEEN